MKMGRVSAEQIIGFIWRESHACPVHPIAPGQAVAMDDRPDRLHVALDPDNLIPRIHFG